MGWLVAAALGDVMPKFPTDRIADLSTAHLSLQDIAALESGAFESTVIKYSQGFFVYTGGSDKDSRRKCIVFYKDAGLHPSVLNIIRAAGAQGCKWVNFDADGPVIKRLKTYKH